MYTILIKDLKVRATHGLLLEEKIHEQEFLINTEVSCKFPKSLAEQDIFDDSFCYGIMRGGIINVCKNNRFNTIETLALTINNELLQGCGDSISITTSIEKTELLKDCRVGIKLTTNKSG